MFSTASYTPERLAARAEILDRIDLYFHAADRRRWALMGLVFHDDATWRMSSVGGQGWRDTARVCEDLFTGSLLYTHHQRGNVLIRLEGGTAWVETYATAYHRVRADAPLGGIFGGTGCEYDLIGGLRYCDRFDFRNGEWRIAVREGASDWRHLQPASDGVLSAVRPQSRGRHDELDPSTPVLAALLAPPPPPPDRP